MSNITQRTARQNRVFKGNLELLLINGQGAFVLPQPANTYELRLYRHNNVVPFATATAANGKITVAATAAATVVTYNFPASDMQGLLGYGSMELISTVANSAPVVVAPLMFVKEDVPYTIEDGQKLVIFDETIVCVVNNAQLQEQLSSVAVTVNVLAPNAQASAVFNGNTLTLNIPKGDTGSNGVMSAAEVLKGTGARALFADKPNLLGRKALILDLIGGGAAHMSDSGGEYLGAIENIPSATFTRSSTARRRTGKRGGETIAANLPRYHHNKDGTPRGTLYERVSTNLLHSTTTMVGWTVAAVAISGGLSDPDGGNAAFKYTENTTTGVHYIYSNTFPITVTQTHSASGFIKAAGRSKIQISVLDQATSTFGFTCIFDLVAKTVTPSNNGAGTEAAGTLEEWYNGWFRFTISGKLNGAAANAFLFIFPLNAAQSATYTGDGFSGIQVYGLQSESGMPTSWIPTTTNAAVTRAADSHFIPLIGFKSDAITAAIQFIVPAQDVGVKWAFGVRGNQSQTASGYGYFYIGSVGGQLLAGRGDDVTGWFPAVLPSLLTPGETYKAVVRLSKTTGKISLAAKGQAIVHSPSENFPELTITNLFVGGWYGTFIFNESIQMLEISNHEWSDTDMTSWVNS
jgi:hypothetical protein